jgi:hypothetical protein
LLFTKKAKIFLLANVGLVKASSSKSLPTIIGEGLCHGHVLIEMVDRKSLLLLERKSLIEHHQLKVMMLQFH